MKILVIGAGLSGLTTSVALQKQGHAVTICAADSPVFSPSVIAGAIWHPFFQEPDGDYLRRAIRTYNYLETLSRTENSGIHFRHLTEYFSKKIDDLWWIAGISDVERIDGGQLSSHYKSAYRLLVPIADTETYLLYLYNNFINSGGDFKRDYISSIPRYIFDEYDNVINCSGYGASYICDDHEVSLVRGVVIQIEKPAGYSGCFIDDSDPRKPTYIIERTNDCILGGTAEPALTGTVIDSDVIADILARCAALSPKVRNPKIRKTMVGFRPKRSSVCLGVDPEQPRLIHNYGHGGAGFTLSWGCAGEVAELINALA